MTEETVDIKEQYKQLCKLYKLPTYSKMNEMFEISDLDAVDFLLRNIRRRMHERVSTLVKIIQELLHPESTLISMFEYKIFTDEERAKIVKLFRRLMYLERNGLELDIINDDKKDFEYILYVYKQWKSIVKEAQHVLSKTKKAWEKEIVSTERLTYFG